MNSVLLRSKQKGLTLRSDVRIIDIFTGQTKRILANIVEQGHEITQFKLYLNHKKFIIGDNKGIIKTFSYHNGALYAENICHSHEISYVKIDFYNKLIISGGWNSQILV
jgi:hypothetical protein